MRGGTTLASFSKFPSGVLPSESEKDVAVRFVGLQCADISSRDLLDVLRFLSFTPDVHLELLRRTQWAAWVIWVISCW